MRILFAAIILGVFLLISPVMAQDATPVPAFTCDAASLQDQINIFIGAMGALKTGGETDLVKIADRLQEAANTANLLRATCDGLVFEGDANKVLGPIHFPAGVYRAIAEADNENGISVTLTPTKGECGAGSDYYSPSLFLVSKGETLFGSKDCEALIEIKMFSGKWKLSFVRISTS